MPLAVSVALSTVLATLTALAISPAVATQQMKFYKHWGFQGSHLDGSYGLDQCFSVGCIDKAISSFTYDYTDVPSLWGGAFAFYGTGDCSGEPLWQLAVPPSGQGQVDRVPDSVNDLISSFAVRTMWAKCPIAGDVVVGCDTNSGTFYP